MSRMCSPAADPSSGEFRFEAALENRVSLRRLGELAAIVTSTRRLNLRSFRREDLLPAMELLQSSSLESCFPRFRHGQAVCERRLRSFYLPETPGLIAHFSVTLAANLEFLGCVSVDVERCEFEYWIGSTHWRQGYAREALSALMPMWSAAGVGPGLRACTARSNRASVALLLSLGFRYIGNTIPLDGPSMLRFARQSGR